jgi:hypothetical protein
VPYCQRCRIVPMDATEYAKGLRRCPRCRRDGKTFLPAANAIPPQPDDEEAANAEIQRGLAEVWAARKARGTW